MKPSRAYTVFQGTILLIGFTILLSTLVRMNLDARYLPELAVFFFLILLSEMFPIRVPGSHVEMAMTVPAVISLMLSHGADPAIIISLTAMFVGMAIVHRRHSIRYVCYWASFNTSISAIYIFSACLVYRLAGGIPLVDNPEIALSSIAIPLIAAVIMVAVINTLILTIDLTLYHRQPWRLTFAQQVRWVIPNYVITMPSAVLFAYLYQQFGIYGILLVIVPFLVGRQALNIYAQQTQAYRETITTLGAYMQEYHPYTRGHLERVANLADKVARTMGLPTQSLMFIRDAGLLHDIGKVGVDEAVLDKIGKLTDEEWATIKQHPATGSEILAQMKYLEPVVPWVRGHHERPDGRGYPDGLKLNDIPLEAAVLSVADAFDAMTGKDEKDTRVYRKPLTLDQAVDQVRYGAGSQFDSRVVKAFLRVMARQEESSGDV